jgi:hypothetical protein
MYVYCILLKNINFLPIWPNREMKPLYVLPYKVYYIYQRTVIDKYGSAVDIHLAGERWGNSENILLE